MWREQGKDILMPLVFVAPLPLSDPASRLQFHAKRGTVAVRFLHSGKLTQIVSAQAEMQGGTDDPPL